MLNLEKCDKLHTHMYAYVYIVYNICSIYTHIERATAYNFPFICAPNKMLMHLFHYILATFLESFQCLQSPTVVSGDDTKMHATSSPTNISLSYRYMLENVSVEGENSTVAQS